MLIQAEKTAMKYVEVLKFCLSLPNTERKTVTEPGINRIELMVGSAVFGIFETGAPIQWQFSLRVEPLTGKKLIDPPHVRKAQETNADDDGWITIQRVENFDGDLLKKLIAWSYQQAAHKP